MKKAISLILIIFMLITSISSLSSCGLLEDLLDKDEKKEDSGFDEGTGTEEDPFIISNAKELKNLAKKINDPDTYEEYTTKHYKLSKDIDLEGEEWTPICFIDSSNLFFQGVFDGDGHTISNWKITDNTYRRTGLFGAVSGTVKNLKISRFEICFIDENNSSQKTIGGIVGELGGNSTVLENCSAEGQINVTSNSLLQVGGLVGRTYSYSETTPSVIQNCHSNVIVTVDSTMVNGTYEAIGIVCGVFAGSLGQSEITDCTATASIQVTSRTNGSKVGVFAGGSMACRFKNCSAEGNVKISRLDYDAEQGYRASYGGGFLGDAENSIIESSFFNGKLDVTGIGNFYVGGLVGKMFNRYAAWTGCGIKNSYAMGSVNLEGNGVFSFYNENGAYVGGLIGLVDSVEISDSYAANRITAFYTESELNVGGLVGEASEQATLKNSFSVGDITATCTITNPEALKYSHSRLNIGTLLGNIENDPVIENCYTVEGQSNLGVFNSIAQEFANYDFEKNLPSTTKDTLNAIYFYTDTLSWDKNVWNFSNLNAYSGKYPTLKVAN